MHKAIKAGLDPFIMLGIYLVWPIAKALSQAAEKRLRKRFGLPPEPPTNPGDPPFISPVK